MAEVTRWKFAFWSFLQDRGVGLYSHDHKWHELTEGERKAYLSEADYYLARTREEWPNDILERLKES